MRQVFSWKSKYPGIIFLTMSTRLSSKAEQEECNQTNSCVLQFFTPGDILKGYVRQFEMTLFYCQNLGIFSIMTFILIPLQLLDLLNFLILCDTHSINEGNWAWVSVSIPIQENTFKHISSHQGSFK